MLVVRTFDYAPGLSVFDEGAGQSVCPRMHEFGKSVMKRYNVFILAEDSPEKCNFSPRMALSLSSSAVR